MNWRGPVGGFRDTGEKFRKKKTFEGKINGIPSRDVGYSASTPAPILASLNYCVQSVLT